MGCNVSARPIMNKFLAATAGAVLLSGCASWGPQAEEASGDQGNQGAKNPPTREQVNSLEQSLVRQGEALAELRQKLNAEQEGAGRLEKVTKQVGSLRERLHSLEGSAEVNGHELERIGRMLDKEVSSLRSTVTQLESRLSELEKEVTRLAQAQQAADRQAQQAASEQPAKEETAQTEPEGPADKRAYDAAYEDLRQGDHAQAITGFRRFLETYPESRFADNAQYWLGEAYYVRGRYERALEAFRQVASNFPESDKKPAALLKQGYAYYELEDYRNARKVLLRVAREYEDGRVGELARKRLERIREEQY